MVAGKAVIVNDIGSIESSVQSSWPIPLAVLIVFYGAFLAFAVWVYLSERGQSSRLLRGILAGHRFLLFVLIVWMLTGWNLHRVRIDPPELIIAVDVSDSMLTGDSSSGLTSSSSTTESGKSTSADTSSTGTSVRSDTASRSSSDNRLQRVASLLNLGKSRLAQLQDRYRLRLYVVADELLPVSTEGSIEQSDLLKLADAKQWPMNKSASRLGDSLNLMIQRQAGRGTAAMVFVSDGTNTVGTSLLDAGQQARRSAIPIHAITIGRQTEQPDVRVTDLLCDDQVYLGDRVTVDATIAASEINNQTVTVNLQDAKNGKVLDQKSVSISSSAGQQTVQLAFTPEQPGLIDLRVTVGALNGEVNVSNNFAERPLNVENRLIRVLIVFGNPSYEFRFLKHFLERTTEGVKDKVATFQLSSILQDGDLDYVTQDSSAKRFVPTDPSDLSQIDAFVFGSFDPNIIPKSTQQAIVRAVTQGGAGCIFVGSDGNFIQRLQGSPLASLLPIESATRSIETGEFKVTATKLGESALPLQWAATGADSVAQADKMPMLQSVMRLSGLRPGAQLLAQAVNADDGTALPLMVSQFAGAGRTMMLATDETYRWTGAFGSDSIHQTFWGQTLRWISRGKLTSLDKPELTVEPKQANLATPIRVRLRLPSSIELPETAMIRINGSDGSQRTQSLPRLAGSMNSYQAVLNQLPAGSYRIVLTTPMLESSTAADFVVLAPPGESANLRADVAAMKQLAEISRGKYYDESNAAEWVDQLPPGRPTRLGALPPKPLWNSPWVALAFICIITSEWLLRRKARMH